MDDRFMTAAVPSVPASGSPASNGQFYEVVEDNIRALVSRWYLEPLKAMDDPDYGFIILMILFPLYEKHLRVSHGLDENASENSKFVRQVARDLGVQEDVAYILWNHYRNGLLHRAMPKASNSIKFALVRKGPPIQHDGAQLWINPFEMRNRLLPIIEADRSMWKENDFPLAVEFREYVQKK